MGAVVKVWSGTAWVPKPTKVWSGSAWVSKPVKVWSGSAWVGGSVVYADNYNRANAALEASPVASGGWSWVHDGAISSAATITSNALKSGTTDATGSAYMTPALPSANQYGQYRSTQVSSTSGFGACVRMSDRDNFIGIRTVGTGIIDVQRKVAGAYTLLYQSAASTTVVGDILRVEVVGSNYRVLRNGVEVKTWTAIGATLSGLSGGVLLRSTLSATYEDFEVGTL